MSLVESAHRRHVSFHADIARKAVPDHGIDLKRKPKPMVIQIAPLDVVQEVSVAVIAPIISEPAFPPTARAIVQVIAAIYDTPVERILGTLRTKPTVRIRHIAMYVVREFQARKSYPEIGRRFGKRDHTSTVHACQKIQNQCNTDMAIAAEVAGVIAKVKSELRLGNS